MTIKAYTATAVAVCLAAGLISTDALAQLSPGPSPCVNDPHFRDFDFWRGQWKVTNRANGQLAGTNTITAVEGSCVLEERWTGTGGSSGMSINYYNPVTGKWRQVWLSGGAYAIDIIGGLNEEGAMALEGTIFYYGRGTQLPFRGTWTPNQDGSVRQYFQQADPTSGEWKDWFDGLYVKAEEAAD